MECGVAQGGESRAIPAVAGRIDGDLLLSGR
jgi:hypothetical protein